MQQFQQESEQTTPNQTARIKLNLSRKNLGADNSNLLFLIQALQTHQQLTHLDISMNSLKIEQVTLLANATTLRYLNISGN